MYCYALHCLSPSKTCWLQYIPIIPGLLYYNLYVYDILCSVTKLDNQMKNKFFLSMSMLLLCCNIKILVEGT